MNATPEKQNANVLLKWLFLVVLSTGFQCFQESGLNRLNAIELVGQRQAQRTNAGKSKFEWKASAVGKLHFQGYKNRQIAVLKLLNYRLSHLSRLFNHRNSRLHPVVVNQHIDYQHFQSRSLASEEPPHFHS
jgi:hypothetical protein